ncbi:MAG: TonB-dependent receptor plug domain-containing protein [Leptolyngbyaceae cyanobacterium SL_5_14]|nr:TonB-dependent receptor plug domain-containing protein [Leptolyngbyaceae cyanobacterium SL_5_14]
MARIFRGFTTTATSQLRNGYRTGGTYQLIPEEPTVAIENIEVLRGPGSVLFGALEPGGVINVITRQPLREPTTVSLLKQVITAFISQALIYQAH